MTCDLISNWHYLASKWSSRICIWLEAGQMASVRGIRHSAAAIVVGQRARIDFLSGEKESEWRAPVRVLRRLFRCCHSLFATFETGASACGWPGRP
jgi:hypothetical protein